MHLPLRKPKPTDANDLPKDRLGGPVALKALAEKWPLHGWLGIVLVAIFWSLNWSLPGLRTHWAFFPLWLGYCLTVDALVFLRKGSSLATDNPRAYMMLFLISAPAWWLFELLNLRTQNWFYDGREFFTDLQYFVLASLSFSTVIPAVFSTAQLVSTFTWLRRIGPGPMVAPTRRVQYIFLLSGLSMLALLLIWPRYFFPFLWGALFLILESLNVWSGHPSILQYTARRDWRPVLALSIGCLICGFFWEMWNYRSYPRWIYSVPFVGFLHIFEMPLLGYLGYVPFSLELFALYHLVIGLCKKDPVSVF